MIITPWFAPAFRAGGPVQSIVHLVNQNNKDIEYYIFCSKHDVDGTQLSVIDSDQWIVFNEHTKVWYNSISLPYRAFQNALKQIQPNVLFIIGVYSFAYNLLPLLICKAPKKILSVRGMLHPGALSQKSWKKKLYISLLNGLNIQKRVWFHATDDIEEQYIKYQFGIRARIDIAGNFPAQLLKVPELPKSVGELSMVSIALISPMKNYLLVLKALQHCKANIMYHICGAIKDKPYWEQCLQQIQQLLPNITVQYHGEVFPGQVVEYLQQAHLAILPSKSENFGHSIYEALSVGKPVITSFGTPWLNLKNDQAGLNVDPETNELLNAISSFAEMDNEEYGKWCKGAVDYAGRAIDRGKLELEYERMFEVK